MRITGAFLILAVVHVAFAEEYVVGEFYAWDVFPTRSNIAEHRDGSLQLGRGDFADLINAAEVYLSFEIPPERSDERADTRLVRFERKPGQSRADQTRIKTSSIAQSAAHQNVRSYTSHIETVSDAPQGFRSGLFRGGPGLELGVHEDAISKSLFSSYAQWHELTIAFYLNVLDVREGATVFAWEHIPDAINAPMQSIRVYIRDGKLVWDFFNVFQVDGVHHSLTLSADKVIVPKTWQFYQLSVNVADARMHYYIDRNLIRVENITQQHKKPVSSVVLPGSLNALVIGERFTGLIDEFLITPRAHPYSFTSQVWKDSGALTSDIIDLGEGVHELQRIAVHVSKSEQAIVDVLYRADSDITRFEAKKWRRLPENGIPEEATRGRFVQIHMDWYADQLSELPIRLERVVVDARATHPLPPPKDLRTQVVDNAVRIQWNPVNMPDLDGYMLYLSENQRLHHTQEQPLRSIDAGMVETYQLTALEHGKSYFVAIGAYRSGEHESLILFSDPIQFRILAP